MHESRENYLETIYLLQREYEKVRAVDVANALGFSKASVSRALALLKKSNHIEIAQGGKIVLTKEGKKLAKALVDKHETITHFLMITTGVSAEVAELDACRIEHFIQKETYKGIQAFIKEVQNYENDA